MQKKVNTDAKKTTGISLIKVAGMTLLILLLIFALGYVLTDNDKTDDLSTFTDGKLLYSATSDNIKDIQTYNNGEIAVLTDTSVKYFDAYGNNKASNECLYSNPVMKTSGSTLLLFDRGAYSLRLEKNTDIYSELTFDSIITTATLGKKSNYAYILNANDGYQSHLYIFSYRGSKQFEWGYASDYVTDVALSDNGRYACAAAMNADNAEYYSTVNLFKFNSEDPVYTLKFDGIAVYSVTFVTNKKVAIYTDNGVYLIDSKGEYKSLQEYSSSEMKFSSFSSSDLGCTVIDRYGNEKNALLTCFTDKYKSLFTKEYKETVKSLSCSKEYVAVAFADYMQLYNSEGNFMGSYHFDDTCIDCCVSGRKIYVLFADGIKCYSVSGAKAA